jgi:fatty-acyl-CoA synthase
MAALELHSGAAFDAVSFRAFLDEQRDLGTKWAPRFVRIVDAMPVTGTDKFDKKPLKHAAWNTNDPVWWRPTRGARYRRLDPTDVEQLAAAFRQHEREHLLPR